MGEIVMYIVVFLVAIAAVYLGTKIPNDKKKKLMDLSDIVKTVAQDVVLAVEQIGETEQLTSEQKKEKAMAMATDILKNHGITVEGKDSTLLNAAIEAAVFILDKQFAKPKS